MITKYIYLFFIAGVTVQVSTIYVVKDDCPKNEEYLLCGSSCPFNCTDPRGPVNCFEDCVEGCFCKAGYLRHSNGTCVNADTCLMDNTVCADTEEFLACGCTATCSDPEPAECGCNVGCFCKSGFVRDLATGQCVKLDNCTVEQCFNQNEVYDICMASCEPTCVDPEPICAKVCTAGCVCAPGLFRHSNGTCVSVEKCPKTNGTAGPLGKYIDAIGKILHLTAV